MQLFFARFYAHAALTRTSQYRTLFFGGGLKKKIYIYAKQYICDQWKPKQVNMKIAKVSRELSYDCWGTQPSEQARAMSVASLIG